MVIVEVLLFSLLLALGIAVSLTDIRYGLIRNKLLLCFLPPALILDSIYYYFYARDTLKDFILNYLLVSLIVLVLYRSHSFAGGDFKLCMVFGLLYPARLYFPYSGSVLTLFWAIGFGILYGYLYLVATTLYQYATGRKKLAFPSLYKKIKEYISSCLCLSVYLSVINLFLHYIRASFFIGIPTWFSWIFCTLFSWHFSKKPSIKKPLLLIPALIVVIIVSIYTSMIPFSLEPQTYLLSAALLFFQIVVSEAIYIEIPYDQLEEGMILSTSFSLLFQFSGTNDLPSISTEDLRSRLTDAEARAVQRWCKYHKGIKNVSIMKKIPFAVFLFLGFISSFVIWSIVK